MSSPELARALERLEGGGPWKATLEELLRELDDDASDRLMQVLREARGSWLALLHGAAGRALFLGDPLSGTPVALARAGFDVTVVAPDPVGAGLAAWRGTDGAGRRTAALVARGPRLPFRDGAFDLVVLEGPEPERVDPPSVREALRIGRGEVVLVADNRWAYKAWGGRRGRFELARPGALLRRLVDRREPRRSLEGYRRELRTAGVQSVRAFALYPHTLDFALVAGLDGGGPSLFVGPKERENRPKVLAHRLGVWRWVTPSFALLGARSAGAARRIDRVLGALAQRLGGPVRRIERWISSRGNTAVIFAGPWVLHLPLQKYQERQARRHFARLEDLRRRFPEVPVPEPLFAGELDGLTVFCESRVDGLTAPQRVGEHGVLARTFAAASRHLAHLVVEPEAVCDEAAFETLVAAKFDLVARHAADPKLEEELAALRDATRERLLGRPLPRVVYHADLRGKHVVLDARGEVNGLLDWGSSEDADLPYFDLLHLIVHERKQAHGGSPGAAWRALRDAGPDPAEGRALDDYAARLGLDPEVRGALEAIYPVLVAAMAEANWDYSRPRWFRRNFGVLDA